MKKKSVLFCVLAIFGIVTGVYAQKKENFVMPTGKYSPVRVGNLLAERYLSLPFRGYGSLRDTMPKMISYPEVCTWTGALRFSRATGDKLLTRELEKRYVMLMEKKPQLVPKAVHVDQSVFGAVPLELYRMTSNKKYLADGLKFADAQWTVPAGKKLSKAAQLNVSKGLSWQTRFWIDDMYMITILQLEAFRATGDSMYLNRMAHEMCAYLDSIQRPNGLFYHAPDVPIFWGRGDGWVAVGMAEILRCLPQNSAERRQIMKSYLKMMKTLKSYQHSDGLWGQLIDDPASWTETSGSAMFTYAMIVGVRKGWLPASKYSPVINKAWKGLVECINKDGDVLRTCQGTGKKNDKQYYLDRKCFIGDMHGQAPVLWCAMAMIE